MAVVAEMLSQEKIQLLHLPQQVISALQNNILTLARTKDIVAHAPVSTRADERMQKGYVVECYVGQQIQSAVPHLAGPDRLARVHTVPFELTATPDAYGSQVKYAHGPQDKLEVDVVQFVRVPAATQAALHIPEAPIRRQLFDVEKVGVTAPQPLSVPLLAEVTTHNGDHGVDKVRHLVSPQRLATVGEVFAPHRAFAHVVVCPFHVAQLAAGLPEVNAYQQKGGILATLPFNGGDVLDVLHKISDASSRPPLFSVET